MKPNASMKLRLLVILFAAALFAATAAGAATSLAVTAAAAMGPDNGGTACGGGNCGMEVLYDGSTNVAKVVDDTPNNESVYRVQLWYDPTGLTPNPSTTGFFHTIMRATEVTAFRSAFQLLLTQKSGLYRLFARCLTNNPATIKFTDRIDLTGANLIQIEWTQSPTAGVGGGNLVMTVLEGPQAGQSVQVLGGGLNNSTLNVDDVHMGGVGSLSAQVVGSEYFDEFASFRSLAP